MESNFATVNEKSNFDRVKKITLMEKKKFHYINESNTWNIPSSYTKLLGHCYNCDEKYHIVRKCLLSCNVENIIQVKEAHEASCGNGSVQGKGIQRNNNYGKCKHNKEESIGGDNKNYKRFNFGNNVQKRRNIWMLYYNHNKCG